MTAILGPITVHYSVPNQQAYIVLIVTQTKISRLHSAPILLLFTDRNIRGWRGGKPFAPTGCKNLKDSLGVIPIS